jgi:hypothetical protein
MPTHAAFLQTAVARGRYKSAIYLQQRQNESVDGWVGLVSETKGMLLRATNRLHRPCCILHTHCVSSTASHLTSRYALVRPGQQATRTAHAN